VNVNLALVITGLTQRVSRCYGNYINTERPTNMVFHIYEDNRTKEYTQEWSMTIGYNTITYYSYNKVEQDTVNYKFLDILNVMRFTEGVHRMNNTTHTPTLIWEDAF
jgi:hypothetical protein